MATSQLIEALQELAHERKIDEFYLIERLEESLANSYQRILDLEWDARVTIDQMPRTGSGCCFAAPGVQGGTAVLAQMPSAESESKPSEEKNEPDTIPDDEIPWDYLGE